MNNQQILQSARRVLQLRQVAIPTSIVRLKSEITFGERPWDKSTRAVVDELPDVISPAEIKSRHLPGADYHSPQVFEPKTDKNILKGRHAGTHFDLSYQNWERNQNKDVRSRMKQKDSEFESFKASRLMQYQQYGTFESNRGNISGRPGLSNSTPMTLHHLAKSKAASVSSGDRHESLTKSGSQPAIEPPSK